MCIGMYQDSSKSCNHYPERKAIAKHSCSGKTPHFLYN